LSLFFIVFANYYSHRAALSQAQGFASFSARCV